MTNDDATDDEEIIVSMFGTELVAERDGDDIRLGARNDEHDLTFLVSNREAWVYLRRLVSLVKDGEWSD